MVELLQQGSESIFEVSEVCDPALDGVNRPTHMQNRPKGVSMQTAALVAVRNVGEPVGSLECELLENLGVLGHAIPRILWVCNDRRHHGCSRQYPSAAAVLRSRSGPSIG